MRERERGDDTKVGKRPEMIKRADEGETVRWEKGREESEKNLKRVTE